MVITGGTLADFILCFALKPFLEEDLFLWINRLLIELYSSLLNFLIVYLLILCDFKVSMFYY